MMPKQDCPVCGNRPTVFYENELEVALERASKKFKAIREHMDKERGAVHVMLHLKQIGAVDMAEWMNHLIKLIGPTE